MGNLSQSNSAAILKGQKYRITVLTERLLRLEYSPDGKFVDEKTELAINRNFPVPQFKVQQDGQFLQISTDYFILTYKKEAPFNAAKFAPDSNLKVTLVIITILKREILEVLLYHLMQMELILNYLMDYIQLMALLQLMILIV